MLNFGDKVIVHALKHNNTIYRKWKNYYVLEDNHNFIVIFSKLPILQNINKKDRYIKDLTIWKMYKNRWSNILCSQNNNNKYYYYCNIASPINIQNNTISFIDYELDIKLNSETIGYKVVDLAEFNHNRIKYNYSSAIIDHCWKEISILKQEILNKSNLFDYNVINNYLKIIK